MGYEVNVVTGSDGSKAFEPGLKVTDEIGERPDPWERYDNKEKHRLSEEVNFGDLLSREKSEYIAWRIYEDAGGNINLRLKVLYQAGDGYQVITIQDTQWLGRNYCIWKRAVRHG